MSNTKLTPGPWRLDIAFSELLIWSGDTGETDTVICKVKSEKDAALIAAAPELYAACEEISSALDGLVETDEVYPAIAKVREAIRKARGEMTIEKESA